MNINYNFHKKSYPKLAEILKTLKNENVETNTVLHKYLPEIEGLQNFFNLTVPPINNEVDVTKNVSQTKSEDVDKGCDESGIQSLLLCEEIEYSTDEVVDVIKECIKSTAPLPKEIENALHNDKQMKKVIEVFTLAFNSEEAHKLGYYICNSNAVPLIQHYFSKIVIPTLKKEQSLHSQHMFVYFYGHYKNLVKEMVVSSILRDEEVNILLGNLSKLESNDKSSLLSDLLEEINTLNRKHLTILLHFLDINSDFEEQQKIINLMYISADDFVYDKSYGKLLISIIECTGKNLNQVENHIRQILYKHKSIWKKKAEKKFSSVLKSNLLSQSVMHQ